MSLGQGTTAGAGPRIVVVGKGGAGKSTIAAVVARVLARRGFGVVAVDADEQRNLGATLGVAPAVLASVEPVAANADYVEEKTGARPGGGAGGMVCLNPDTSDIVDRLAVPAPDGVRLLVMGGVQRAGGGCLCPEHALISATVGNMALRQGDVVVMDTHAGVEHFGRALARGFDTAAVVVEPTFNSVQVGLESARLGLQLGIERIELVVNRTTGPDSRRRVQSHLETLGGFPFTGSVVVPFDEMVARTEPSVDALLGGSALLDAVGPWALGLVGGQDPGEGRD